MLFKDLNEYSETTFRKKIKLSKQKRNVPSADTKHFRCMKIAKKQHVFIQVVHYI